MEYPLISTSALKWYDFRWVSVRKKNGINVLEEFICSWSAFILHFWLSMPVSIPSMFRRKKEDTLVLMLASASTDSSVGDACLECGSMDSPVGHTGRNVEYSNLESVMGYSFVESVTEYSFVESVVASGTFCLGSWLVVPRYDW